MTLKSAIDTFPEIPIGIFRIGVELEWVLSDREGFPWHDQRDDEDFSFRFLLLNVVLGIFLGILQIAGEIKPCNKRKMSHKLLFRFFSSKISTFSIKTLISEEELGVTILANIPNSCISCGMNHWNYISSILYFSQSW